MWPHLAFPFNPWCQSQCVSGPVLGYFSSGSWQRSLCCFVVLRLFSHTHQVHPVVFCAPPHSTPFLLRLENQAVHQLRPLAAVGDWSHQPALSAIGSPATVWHLLPGCKVLQLIFTMACIFVSLFSQLGCIHIPEKKLQSCEKLNTQTACCAPCPVGLQSKHL